VGGVWKSGRGLEQVVARRIEAFELRNGLDAPCWPPPLDEDDQVDRLAKRLREYADFYAETYGNKEEVAELIPFMLEAFLDSDAGFKKCRKKRDGESMGVAS